MASSVTLSLKYNIPLRLDTQKILCKKNWNKCPTLYSQINGKLNHAKVGRPQVIWLSDSLWHQWKTKCLLNYYGSMPYFVMASPQKKSFGNIVPHKHMEKIQVHECIKQK